PVGQACAYGIEALEALGHLHSRNLLYCDFKVDNAIQQEDQLKLIDMGAVRRMDDQDSAIYGTVGYQAPEVAETGPSVASDLYTVARTLAVLTFDFQGYTSVYLDVLPDPEHIEVFSRYESFYRLLVRATDPDPGRRFASAEEMADQLTGVLREVVALQTCLLYT
ncbi:serine/threonine protein kinase, partial [Streptomyces varsoviensis]